MGRESPADPCVSVSIRGRLSLAREERVVLGAVHQGFVLGGVREAEFGEPTAGLGLGVDGLGRVEAAINSFGSIALICLAALCMSIEMSGNRTGMPRGRPDLLSPPIGSSLGR